LISTEDFNVTYKLLAVVGLVLGCCASVAAENALKSGVITGHADSGVRAQDDFFRAVNGKWLKEGEIPADKPMYGAFFELREQSEKHVREIIENAAKEQSGGEGKKIADLYASFMDEQRVEELGLKPIQAELDAVEAIKDVPGMLTQIALLQRQGVSGLFGMYVGPDSKKSSENIPYLNQGGIGLPDESYYREEKYKDLRASYLAHIEKMFTLAKRPKAKESAALVMKMETAIAKGHWDNVRNRDAEKTYNKVTRGELKKLAGGLELEPWFAAIGAAKVETLIVGQPSFVTDLAKTLDAYSIDDWKEYFAWRVISSRASLLPKAFVEENFDFYGKTMNGMPEMEPRWKRGVSMVERSLGEAVGKVYVEKHFPPKAKERMKELVANLVEAYRVDIVALDWMSPETKTRALAKLAKFTPKIGYPDKWRDYSKLEILSDDLVGNARRAAEFSLNYQLDKLGKPVDRTEWFMTPQTVNAYYNPEMNEIVFPAAILQPPFFDLEADDAVNYGGIGAVIGHEIGHGFDDQGSKYDGDGNLLDWWTKDDRIEFEKRAKMLIDQYNAYSPEQLPMQRVNGALTIGENIGDLGGLTIAHKAYMISLTGKKAPVLDGYTGSQRVFIGWAQVWRAKYRDAAMARMLATNPHSPPEFRCNGVVRNLVEFYEAFGVKEGDKLWLPAEKRVRIW
jgi:putative endopeptidase